MKTQAAPGSDIKSDASVVLDVQDLHVHYAHESGSLHAVRGIGFSLRAGETLAIVGESGSGKSATAMAIMGLQPPGARVEGSIRLHGKELTELDDASMSRLRGESIAMVFQDPLSALTPVYTIGEQIVETILVHTDYSVEQARDRAVELLQLVGIPEPAQRINAYPYEFSGGMRQRVIIAMAMANNPDVIIADEPTTALDVTIQAQVLDVLQQACEETNAALILITHDLGVVARVADSAIVMYAGRAVEQGDVHSLFYQSRMPYTIGLLASLPEAGVSTSKALSTIPGNPPSMLALPAGCTFSPRCSMVCKACLEKEPEMESVDERNHLVACFRQQEIVGGSTIQTDLSEAESSAAALSTRKLGVQGPNILELSSVKQHYPLFEGAVMRRRVGTVYAVDGIDLYLKEGETLGIVGESGCGKSTTTRAILDLKPPTEGHIKLFGTDVRELKDRAAQLEVRRKLQIVFQDPIASLDPRMPVFDLIAEPMGVFEYSDQQIRSRVNDLLALVGLDSDQLLRYPQQLSGGQCQRVCIARALALEPRILILDEPVSALDVSIRAGIINLLQSLKESLGLSYLFVAHDLALVRYLADRVAVMYLGRIVECGDVESVYTNPMHPYTRCLLSAMPVADPEEERSRTRLLPMGEPPSPANPPAGCRFHTRCPKKASLSTEQQGRCVNESPSLQPVQKMEHSTSSPTIQHHTVACHHNSLLWDVQR